MNILRVVIVDDEPDSIKLLQTQLEKYSSQIHVLATYTNSEKALKALEILDFDLLFLDIEMPVMNGFEMLEKLVNIKFKIIFVTAYNEFALKAFKFNALDYLVKPFDTTELLEAVTKAHNRESPSGGEIAQLKKQLLGEPINKIAIPCNTGVVFIDFTEIIYVEASNNYSKILLADKRHFTISKTLKDVQEVFEQRHFLRVHRQYIINLNCLKQFNRNESILTMINGDILPIARTQKERLIERYGWL